MGGSDRGGVEYEGLGFGGIDSEALSVAVGVEEVEEVLQGFRGVGEQDQVVGIHDVGDGGGPVVELYAQVGWEADVVDIEGEEERGEGAALTDPT